MLLAIKYNCIRIFFTSKLRLRVDDISNSFWSRTNLQYKPKLAFVKPVQTQQNDGWKQEQSAQMERGRPHAGQCGCQSVYIVQ